MTQLFVLDSTTKTLKVNLTAAPAAANPEFTVAYADSNGTIFTEGSTDGVLNGTTDVTLVSAPPSGYRRIIKSMSIYNKDTASVTVNLKYDNNGTQRIAQRIPLATTETYTLDGTFDNTGSLKTSFNRGDPLLTSLSGTVWQASTPTNQITLNGINFISGPAFLRFRSNATVADVAVNVTSPYFVTANVPAAISSLAGGTLANVVILDLYNRTTNALSFNIGNAAAGGITSQIGNIRVHTFTTTGSFTANSAITIRYLVVAGGGGGGSDMGGGGGAGGYLAADTYVLPAGTYTITVGAGGAGALAGAAQAAASPGTNSSIVGGAVSIIATGGGGGASCHDRSTSPALSGGSGGGASGGAVTGGNGTTNQGFPGGNSGIQWYMAGGGGAGGRGYSNAGHGGNGLYNDITGTGYYWAGGGGGSGYTSIGGNGGLGGGGGGGVGSTTGGSGINNGSAGGGGAPNAQTNTPGGAAGANTGGGGGGGAHYNATNSGGNGGSGIVVIRYTIG